jgi:thioredoxin-like negative regulator of GroEL
MRDYLILLLGAALMFLSACASAPPLPEARKQAQDLLDSGNPNEAAAYIDKIGGSDLGLWLLRAEAAFRAGDLAGAKERYSAIAASARDSEVADFARRNLAAIQLRDEAEASAAYATLNQLTAKAKRNAAVQHQLGVAAVAAGRLDLARKHFARLSETQRQQLDQVLGQDFLNHRSDR